MNVAERLCQKHSAVMRRAQRQLNMEFRLQEDWRYQG